MSKTVTVQHTVELVPSSYNSSSTLTTSNNYPPSNGLSGHESTTYAAFTTSTTSRYARYDFDVSSIPSDATIVSVSCTAKCRTSSTSRVTAIVQLYSENTAKGSSSSFVSTSTSNTETLDTGTWTRSELSGMNLRITGSHTQNSSRTLYFYGATLTVQYSITEIAHTITSLNNSESVERIDPSGLTDVTEGDNWTVSLFSDDVSIVKVYDNDLDVTSSLVHVTVPAQPPQQVTANETASNFTTGYNASNMAFYTSSSSQTHNFQYAIGHTAESPGSTSSGSGSWTYVKVNGDSTNYTGYVDYSFDFSSIPEGSTIDSIQVKCYGAVESSSQSTSHADITLFSGTTQKSTTQSFTSSTNSVITINNPGTWTREELQEAILRFEVGYYGGHIFGITWSVTYTTPEVPSYEYWSYTISSVNEDHIVRIEDFIYIPPEEDPETNYYSLTISAVNASTDPKKGTTRVEEGTGSVITIYPTDPLITLVTDNGTDISSQLVAHGGEPTYTVETQSRGAGYGFTLDQSTGYYTSNNKGVNSSTSLCTVNFDSPVRFLVTIDFINYAEETYDFGVFSKIDTELSTTAWSASSSSGDTTTDAGLEQLRCNTSALNTSSVQTLTYEVPSGQHYIDIKYSKDQGTSSNNDTLQWKISSVTPLETSASYYTYELTDISANHNLIFIFGNVSYHFITSACYNSGVRLNPDGQTVVIENDSYELIIVPKNTNDIVKIYDNGQDTSSLLTKEEYDIQKDGETIKVVNYIYSLNSVNSAHTLTVESLSGSKIYIKINGQWAEVSALYRKSDSRWQEVSDPSECFSSGKILISSKQDQTI